MASWRDKLRPASFRGVPFQVKGREGETGRRGPDHEYPDRDEGYPEDTGRKLRRYKVDAFLLASRLGGDYMPARDRLLEVLEQKGPGEYIDPWGQSWQVQVRAVTWREGFEDGGYVAFAITFVEYSPQALHTVTADTAHAVNQAADKAGAALVDDFGQRYDARGNDQVSGASLDMATDVLDSLNAMLSAASLSRLGMGAVAGVLARIGATRSGLLGLLSTPRALAEGLRGLLSLSLGVQGSGWPRYRAAQGLTDYGSGYPSIPASTPMRAQAAVNQTAMVDLVQGLAAVEMASAAAAIPFAVYDDAVAVRDQVSVTLDQRMLTAPDAVYQPLDGVRAAIVRHITAQGADLTRLAAITTTAETPALVLAHRLYGDAGRAGDVLTRNRGIRHPGFIPGGVTLKVPTHD